MPMPEIFSFLIFESLMTFFIDAFILLITVFLPL